MLREFIIFQAGLGAVWDGSGFSVRGARCGNSSLTMISHFNSQDSDAFKAIKQKASLQCACTDVWIFPACSELANIDSPIGAHRVPQLNDRNTEIVPRRSKADSIIKWEKYKVFFFLPFSRVLAGFTSPSSIIMHCSQTRTFLVVFANRLETFTCY